MPKAVGLARYGTIEEVLRAVPLFASLSPEERDKLAMQTRFRPFAKGEILFREGDEIRNMSVILSGVVKLVKLSPQGREYVIHLIQPGNLLAAAELFTQGGTPVSAVAVNKGHALSIDGAALLRALERNGAFGMALLKAFSFRLRMFTNKLVESQGKFPVPRRVAGWLLHRAKMEGTRELELSITREVLARLLGITRESLSRELSALARQGVIQLERRRIVLLDEARLKRLAENGHAGK